MAVVKGDAYGHGAIECAKTLVKAEAKDLGVLDIQEALALKRAGINADIHIIAGLDGQEDMTRAITSSFVIFAYSFEQISALSEIAKKLNRRARVRLKIDTGMGRLGVSWTGAVELIKSIKKLTSIKVEGLASHLATVGDGEAHNQLEHFKEIQKFAESQLPKPLKHSALAGGGLLAHTGYQDDLSRAGLLLYGYSPLPEDSPYLANLIASRTLIKSLKPVMKVKSRVLQVKTLKAGQTVSYDRTYKAQRDLTMAAVPFGYVHGLSRTHSDKGYALIKGRKAPLLGRVCMNLSLFDVSGLKAAVGDEVVFLGSQGEERIGADLAGSWQQTSAYEIVCLFGRLNPRYYRYGEDSIA
jgi:alanine racemase